MQEKGNFTIDRQSHPGFTHKKCKRKKYLFLLKSQSILNHSFYGQSYKTFANLRTIPKLCIANLDDIWPPPLHDASMTQL